MSLSLEFKQDYLNSVAPTLKDHYWNLLLVSIIDRASNRHSLDKSNQSSLPMLLNESKKKRIKPLRSPMINLWYDHDDWNMSLGVIEDVKASLKLSGIDEGRGVGNIYYDDGGWGMLLGDARKSMDTRVLYPYCYTLDKDYNIIAVLDNTVGEMRSLERVNGGLRYDLLKPFILIPWSIS